MNGETDKVEINGQIFAYDNDTPVQRPKLKSRGLLRRMSTISNEVLSEYRESLSKEDIQADFTEQTPMNIQPQMDYVSKDVPHEAPKAKTNQIAIEP